MVARQLAGRGIRDCRVLAAMAWVPREWFLPPHLASEAYEDAPLPIGSGQTISQPLIVALMTEALAPRRRDRVLEIGTGSGYQTAILARLAARVYSIERFQQLAYQAARRLMQLAISNASLYVGDGSLGWAAAAPYDRILVTAAAPEVPQQLVDQLVTWGILVIPVGGHQRQELLVVHRAPWGPEIRSLGGCVFVPLIGEKGWSE